MAYRDDSIEARVLRGEPQALGLVRRWIAEALTSSRFWSLRNEWADLCQEVMARLVQSLRTERFRPESELRTYVQGICRHTAQQRLSDHSNRFLPGDVGESGGTRGERTPEQEAVAHQLVRRALDMVSEDCRALIAAYFLEGRTYEELAARYGVPVGTVKSRLFRCLECVRLGMLESAGSRRRPDRSIR